MKILKLIIIIVFWLAVFADLVAIACPDVLDVNLTRYSSFLLLIIYYLISSKHYHYIFILILISGLIGTWYYSTAFGRFDGIGLLFFTINLILITITVFSKTEAFSFKSIVLYGLPIVFVLLVIVFYFLYDSDTEWFYNSIIYSGFIVLLTCITSLNYITNKTSRHKVELCIAILFVVSSMFNAVNLFIERTVLFRSLSFLTFSMLHFYVCLYAVNVDNKKIR